MSRYVVIYVIVLGWIVTAQARELEVGSQRAVTSLKEALKIAQDGDILCVDPGTYTPDTVLIIDKSIKLYAQGEVHIKAAEGQGIFEIRADSVSIVGFHLSDVGRSYIKDLSAIWVDYSKHFEISHNKILNCFFGVFCTKSSNGIIRHNVVKSNAEEEHSSANAIHLWYCKKIRIENNLAQQHRDGIYLEFVDSSVIRYNVSTQNLRYGLHFMFSHNNEYAYNVFKTNGSGVAVMFSRHITMHKNHFLNNWGDAAYGLLIKEIYDATLSDNLFYKNTTGVFAEGSSRVAMKDNVFDSNGWAIKMRGNSAKNEISYNSFVGNSFDIATEAKKEENLYHHNYWDDYSGYDLDRDGVGDVPHRPVNLFSYLVSRVDESILLLRSSFVQVLNMAEKVTPALTPVSLVDEQPLMRSPH